MHRFAESHHNTSMQAILEAFISENLSFLAQTNPTTRVTGFSTCLYHIYQHMPQHIASVIAAKLAPMQLPWITVAQSDDILMSQAATPRRHWWQLMRRKTSITPQPPAIGQILWTDSSLSTAHHGKTSYDGHLPGTSSTFADVMQIVTKAVQRLNPQSHSRHPMDSCVPVSICSIAMPLTRGKEDTAATVSSNQTDGLPSCAAYTPRMIEVSVKDGDKQPGSGRGTTFCANTEDTEVDPRRLLLVMCHSGTVVGVPLVLGGHLKTVPQAKAAIIDDARQLMIVLQGILEVVPAKHRHRQD